MTTLKEQADLLRKIAEMMEHEEVRVLQFVLTTGVIDSQTIGGPYSFEVVLRGMRVE